MPVEFLLLRYSRTFDVRSVAQSYASLNFSALFVLHFEHPSIKKQKNLQIDRRFGDEGSLLIYQASRLQELAPFKEQILVGCRVSLGQSLHLSR